MKVRELDIDRINSFGEACAILAKTMSKHSLKKVAAVISAKKVQLSPEEARNLAQRAVKFKQEGGINNIGRRLGKEDGRSRRLPCSHEARGAPRFVDALHGDFGTEDRRI